MWTPPERKKAALPEPGWPTAEQARGARWFQPVQIGPVTARTRTWVPAMVPWRASDEGLVTPEVIEWYARFAAGRPGVLVVEATGIRDVPSGPLLRIGDDRFVSGLAELTRAVREASGGQTRLFIQLIDFLSIRRRPEPGKYFRQFLVLEPRHREALATALGEAAWRDPAQRSDAAVREALVGADEVTVDFVLDSREREALEFGARERVTDVHLPHIAALPRTLPPLFAAAAERAFAAGFDGVELHYAHAYTMASFLSAANTREDGYGGDREGRLRLPLEVLAAVRARVGAGRCVGLRLLGDEVVAEGHGLDDAVFFSTRLAGAGADYLSVSKGGKFEDARQPKIGAAAYPYTGQSGYECMPTVYSDTRGPFGRNVGLSAAIRAGVRTAGLSTPVVAAGGIFGFAQAEAILAAGEADIVASARQTLADPDWFEKMARGRGQEVRRCEFTNYCEALDQQHKAVTCKLWDRVGLDEPDVRLDATGRRRLVAPRWSP
jgi:2,4-dienoyl-CoA reductase-like NADH-dependent reductase (Old Yellow Enzyme family)